MILPGIVLILQQWSLGNQLASMAVYERDGRVRRAVDGFINDTLVEYRRQNEVIYRELFEPLDTSARLDDPLSTSYARLSDVRTRFGRPAALFIARPQGSTFRIRYFALDESDVTREFSEPTLEPVHLAVLGYLHSAIPGWAFRERLADNRYYESCEHWRYGVVHFFHVPIYLNDPVVPRAYAGLWETVDFASQAFLLPHVRGDSFARKLEAEGLNPALFRWSVRSSLGETIFDSAEGRDSRTILDVRLAAYGPLFEPLSFRVDLLAGHVGEAGPAVARQSVFVLSLAALWFMAAGLLLARTATRDRWLARIHRDFVGRISHELKTPVAVTLNAVESLRNPRLATPENMPTLLRMLHDQLRGLASLLDRLIDVSRLTEGAFPIAPRRLNIAEHLRSRIHELRTLAGISEGGLVYNGRPVEPSTVAEVDPTAFDLILRNLLENAVKYAGAGDPHSRPVELDCVAEGRWVILSVRDHGPGIPRGEHRRIFRPFYRVGDSLRMDTPGHGIGLALVRSLVEAHGGWVSVENAPGGGSLFRARFPRASDS